MSAIAVLLQESRVGTFPTASLPIPVNADGTLATNPATGKPYQTIALTSTMNQTDAANAGLHALGAISVSWDGLNWVGDLAWVFAWQGGVHDKNGITYKVPGLGIAIPVDLNGKPPQRAMAKVDTAGTTVNLGLSLEFR